MKKLTEIEDESASLIQGITGVQNEGIPTLENELEELVKNNEFERAYFIIERWLLGDFLKPFELKLLLRRRIEVAIAEGNQPLMKEFLNSFESDTSHDASDYCFLAQTYYLLQQFEIAEKNILRALDLGFPINNLKQVALKIAGKTGNKALVARVSSV